MSLLHLGIRAKLNLGLSALLLGVTAAFGVTYALVERGTVLEMERRHLEHMASLAGLYLEDVGDRGELERTVAEFNQRLSTSGLWPHRLFVQDDQGVVLATSDPHNGSVWTGRKPHDPAEPAGAELRPAILRIELPIALDRYTAAGPDRRPARLVLQEAVPALQEMFMTSLRRHLAFGAALVALAMVVGGVLSHYFVVRPVRDLVAATDRIAKDGDWGPVAPSERRGDEIGVLGDHLAAMSRRLIEAVRAERFGSAHMVAARAHRELDEPLRRTEMQLAVLEKLLPPGSDADHARVEIAAELDELHRIAQRFKVLPANPPA